MTLATLKTSLEQLVRKKDLLRELDDKIAAKLSDVDDLEAEILESEELCCKLEEKMSHISAYSAHTTEPTYDVQFPNCERKHKLIICIGSSFTNWNKWHYI